VIDRPRKWLTPAKCYGIFCWLEPFGAMRKDDCTDYMEANSHPHMRINASATMHTGQVLARAAALARRLLQPNVMLSERLRAERRRLSLDRPYIGVHIRHGDSCSKDQRERKRRTCDSLHAYQPKIEALSRKYHINDVFLATDGGTAICNATRDYPHLTWHYRDVEPPRGLLASSSVPLDIDRLYFRGGQFPFEVGVSALIDVLLLSEATALVGKFTSNAFRASFELSVGRRQCLPPFASLDAPWCFTGGGAAPVLAGPYRGKTFQC
jgi:hypothetical protein